MNGKDIKEIIKVGLILFLITAVSAGALAYINSITAPIIAKNAEEKQNVAMQKVLPNATEFSEIKDLNIENDSSVVALYDAGDEGVVVLCEPKGYGGAISLVVGIDKEGTVSGIDITKQSETAGLGANCSKDEFKEQYKGKTAGIGVSKNGAKDNEIDAISSATITSKAVTKGVNDALEFAQKGGFTK